MQSVISPAHGNYLRYIVPDKKEKNLVHLIKNKDFSFVRQDVSEVITVPANWTQYYILHPRQVPIPLLPLVIPICLSKPLKLVRSVHLIHLTLPELTRLVIFSPPPPRFMVIRSLTHRRKPTGVMSTRSVRVPCMMRPNGFPKPSLWPIFDQKVRIHASSAFSIHTDPV